MFCFDCLGGEWVSLVVHSLISCVSFKCFIHGVGLGVWVGGLGLRFGMGDWVKVRVWDTGVKVRIWDTGVGVRDLGHGG